MISLLLLLLSILFYFLRVRAWLALLSRYFSSEGRKSRDTKQLVTYVYNEVSSSKRTVSKLVPVAGLDLSAI